MLIGLLALLPLIYRHNIIFATFATAVIALALIFMAFQVQKLQLLMRTIAKLDELLELLRDTRREMPSTESKQVMQELAQIRARLLQDSLLKRSKP